MRRRLAAVVSMLMLAMAVAAPVQAFQVHGGRGGYGGHAGYGAPGGGRGGFSGEARGGYGRGAPGGNGRQHGFGGPSGYGPGGYTGREQAYPGRRTYPGPGTYRGPPMPGPEAMAPRGYRSGGGYAPGRWARGQFLPPEARGQVVQDPDRFHLRRPPRGYYWYQSGDEYVLASLATGVIFEVISADDY